MNIEQKTKVISQLEPFWQLDIDKRIAEVYKDYTDLASIVISYYTITEVSTYSKKMISQIGQILETPLGSILPFQYQFQNDFGNGNLGEDLASFNAYLSNNDFNSAVSILIRLVYYQVVNGFWTKVEEKDDRKRFSKIVELESKLNLVTEQVSKNAETNKNLLEALNVEKENLELLVNTKKKELGEIEGLLPTARNNSEEINKLLNTSTATNGSINGLLTQQTKNLEDINKKYEEEKAAHLIFQQEIKELKELFNSEVKASTKKNLDFDTILLSVTDRSSTFDQRIIVLNEIIGKEGAEKLFNTFNDRKNALEKPVDRWSRIVFWTGGFALVLIIGIFTNFFSLMGDIPTTIDWHYLLINSIKSLPVMIVLLFTIKQYVRERMFQEEYAFRSAIALTVQAYGDIAGTKKEELIMKAIATIYSLPSMMKEKSNPIFGYRSKILVDTMKEVTETLKTFR